MNMLFPLGCKKVSSTKLARENQKPAGSDCAAAETIDMWSPGHDQGDLPPHS